MQHHELQVQEQVCQYLRFSYPHVIFRSDYASGLKLTMGQSIIHKRLQSSRAFPDLFIYEPRNGHNGLAIELKRAGVTVYKRDGELVADEHIREQAAMLDKLKERGYVARFACGFDEARQVIDEYLLEKPL